MKRVMVLAGALAVGCLGAPAAKPVSAPPPPPSASLPSPAASAQRPAEQEPASVTAQLTLVGELACEARIFVLPGRTFVACGAELLVVDGEQALRREATLAQGLRLDTASIPPPQVVAIAGQWPNSAWAATTEPSDYGNSSTLRFFRWRKDRWVASGRSAELGGPMSWVIFPWREDGMVALAPTPFGPTRVLAVGQGPTAVPALSRAVQSRADRESYPCQHALIAPEAWVELSPGDVMVFAGQLCGVPTAPDADAVQARHLGVERLRAGQKRGEISLLPLPSGLPADVFWNVAGAAALSPTDVLVAASGSGGLFNLAHFDGQEWRPMPAPFTTLASLWAQAGAFWATDSLGTSWALRGGAWRRVEWRAPVARDAAEVPRHEELSQLIAIDARTTWLVRREEHGHEVTSRIYRVQVEP